MTKESREGRCSNKDRYERGGKRKKEKDGGTQGLVDERLHSWMVQGDRRGAEPKVTANSERTMQRGLSKMKIYCWSSCE